ncbi:hypothetical protein SO802_031967 [Lithocarpus litseifolius]|uniref:Uncharacterized protein n=1 Tax=Lithocarpus litseifolius TaxID=425828 RepID=A0AAW2BLR5_9ROSI
MDILWQMLLAKNVNLDCVSRLVMVAWKLWHSRNEWRLNGVMKSGKQLVFGVMQYWAEFLAAIEGDELSSTTVQKMNWSPPPPGLCKVNFDAATFKDIRSTGIGIVIPGIGNALAGSSSPPSTVASGIQDLALNLELLREGDAI